MAKYGDGLKKVINLKNCFPDTSVNSLIVYSTTFCKLHADIHTRTAGKIHKIN